MNRYKSQRGLGSIGWIGVLLVTVFFGTCAFKMLPAYNENQLVKSALRSLTDGPDSVEDMSDAEIRQKLNSFYTINNVRGEATSNLEIERKRDATLVRIAYEVRVPIFGNVSAVMDFDNVLDSSRPQACCSAP